VLGLCIENVSAGPRATISPKRHLSRQLRACTSVRAEGRVVFLVKVFCSETYYLRLPLKRQIRQSQFDMSSAPLCASLSWSMCMLSASLSLQVFEEGRTNPAHLRQEHRIQMRRHPDVCLLTNSLSAAHGIPFLDSNLRMTFKAS
jgi:hypothetical protein